MVSISTSLKTKFTNGIKNICNPSTFNILLLLSLIIIIILVYLKTNKIELFTYFDKYSNTQNMYKDIHSIMMTHDDNINNFGKNVQQVISGINIGNKPEPTTKKLVLFDTRVNNTRPNTTIPNQMYNIPELNFKLPEQNFNLQDTTYTTIPLSNAMPGNAMPEITMHGITMPGTTMPGTTMPVITIPMITMAPTTTKPGTTTTTTKPGTTMPGITMAPTTTKLGTTTTTPNIDCSTYPDTYVGLPNKCLTELWQATGCTNLDATNNYADNGWWKTQPKSVVRGDMAGWNTNPNVNGHFNFCYGTDQSKWPSVVTINGLNNGTANCSTYCAGRNGASWDNVLPSSWRGSVCTGTNDPLGCNSTNLTLRTGLTCNCKKDDSTPWR